MLCSLKILIISLNIYLCHGQLFLTSNLPRWRMVVSWEMISDLKFWKKFDILCFTLSSKDSSSDSGDQLLLTGLIESGDDYTARKLARVDEKYFLGVVSYSGSWKFSLFRCRSHRTLFPHTGYLTVDKEQHSNLFFWYFPAEGTEYLYEEDEDSEQYEDVRTQRLYNTTSNSDDNRPVVLVTLNYSFRKIKSKRTPFPVATRWSRIIVSIRIVYGKWSLSRKWRRNLDQK